MVQPAIVERLLTTPVVTATRRRINNAFVIMGVETGGNVATALPPNTPTLFRSAPARAAAATGADITNGVAAGDYSVVHHTAQTRGILHSIDPAVRANIRVVDEPLILVNVDQTGAAPPTTNQWNDAIDSLASIRTRYPNIQVTLITVPDYDFLRAATSPYDAVTPTASEGSIPWLARLNTVARDLGADIVLGYPASFSVAEARFWAARNYQSEVALTGPGAQGENATVAAATSMAPVWARSALEIEQDGRGGITGHGVSFHWMPAEGLTGVVPRITQSYTLETTDNFLLKEAGIMTPFNEVGEWVFDGDFVGKDYSTNPPDPRTDVLSVKRYSRSLQQRMQLAARSTFRGGWRGQAFFDHLLSTMRAILRNDAVAGKITDEWSAFELDPARNPATTARVGYRFVPIHPLFTVELEGHIELPS